MAPTSSCKTAHCSLCPRQCAAIRDGDHGEGWCDLSLTPMVARAALHMWEEPCISGANGAGTVFFSGCTLGCVFCQNRSISHENYGKAVGEEELLEIFRRVALQGAHNIELVTPTQYTHALAPVLKKWKQESDLPVVWNSGGYERDSVLRALEGSVDIYLPDLKYVTPALAEKYSKAANYPEAAKSAILEMYRQRGPVRFEGNLLKSGVVIRHLILPGQVAEARRVMDWVAESFPAGSILFSLMAQYTPVGDLTDYPELNRTLRASELRAAGEYMAALGLKGYVQELESVGEGFIPAFDLTGV